MAKKMTKELYEKLSLVWQEKHFASIAKTMNAHAVR